MASPHHNLSQTLDNSNPSPAKSQSSSSSSNVVGVHYRVGKRIGEGSFGIIYEGTVAMPAPSPPTPRNGEYYAD
jgi:casein kinase 1